MKELRQIHKSLTRDQRLRAYEISGYMPSTFNQYLRRNDLQEVQKKLFLKALLEAKSYVKTMYL